MEVVLEMEKSPYALWCIYIYLDSYLSSPKMCLTNKKRRG
jgi:hypothetical protein